MAEKFIKKGSQLYIEGKIRSRSYDDQNGVKRYITEIVADNLELLGRRTAGTDESSSSNYAGKTETPPSSVGTPSDERENISEVDDLPF